MSTDAKISNVRELYVQAARIKEDAARQAYLDEACGSQIELRQRVELLLAAARRSERDNVLQLATSDSMSGRSPLSWDGDDSSKTIDSHPEAMDDHRTRDAAIRGQIDVSTHPMIGSYKLLEEIGHGGMGTVYMAQQTAPVKRKVALKVIKPGMDTKEVIARFEAERQALAMMDHANIAKVLDGGSTAEGRPYFVMELVRGVPITEFCTRKKLPLRERLELFIDICKAVQHAHQKGIIHRDLKPSNLLVTLHDHLPVVKVIDFGVAKALNQELTERTLFTQFSQMIGTPLYMAPEQAQMSGLDIDTRSDIYSLGVVLYELLTGTTPFDRDTMSKLGMDGIRKLLQEQDPDRPSARISTMKAANLSTIDDQRQLDTEDISKQLKRELDWIVMKALEKDRERRYDTANDFADDVQRYLNDEPVEACPPTIVYQLTKYAKRHKVWLTTATVLIVMLITSTIVSSSFAIQAQQAKQDADQSAADAKAAQQVAENEKKNAVAAEQAAVAAKKVSETNLAAALDAVDKLLEHASDGALGGIPQAQAVRFKMMNEALNFYDQFIKSHTGNLPIRHRASQARLEMVFLKNELGETSSYDEHELRIALREMEQVIAGAPDKREYKHTLAYVLQFLGISLSEQGKFDEGMKLLARSGGIYDELVEQFDEDEDRGGKAAILHAEYVTKSKRGDQFDRVAHMNRILDTLRDSPDEGNLHWTYTSAHSVIGKLTRDVDFEAAKQHIEKAINSKRKQVQEGVGGRVTREQLGITLIDTAAFFVPYDLERAIQQSSEAVDLAANMVREFPNLSQLETRLSKALSVRLRLLLTNETSKERHRQIVELLQSHPEYTAELHGIYAQHLQNAAEPIPALTEVIEQFPQQSAYYRYRGVAYRDRDDYESALTDLNKAIELLSDNGDPKTYQSRGMLFVKMKQYEKATADYDKYVERSSHSAQARFDRGEFYLNVLKDYKQAIVDFDFALEKVPHVGHWYKRRGLAHFHLSQFDKALADLNTSLDLQPDDASAVWWIPPSDVANCPDEEFKTGMKALANRAVEVNNQSSESLAVRASLLLAFGELEQAQEDLAAVAVAEDAGFYSLYQVALLSIATDSRPRYTELCQQMLTRFADSDVSKETHFTAWSCALAPAAIEDYEPAIKLARHAVEQEPENQQYLDGLGAVLMRAGEYADAKENLEKALAAADSDHTSTNYISYFLAMTEHHLGNAVAAQEHLQAANESAEKELTESPAWNRKLTLELLRKEAEALIDPTDKADAKENIPN